MYLKETDSERQASKAEDAEAKRQEKVKERKETKLQKTRELRARREEEHRNDIDYAETAKKWGSIVIKICLWSFSLFLFMIALSFLGMGDGALSGVLFLLSALFINPLFFGFFIEKVINFPRWGRAVITIIGIIAGLLTVPSQSNSNEQNMEINSEMENKEDIIEMESDIVEETVYEVSQEMENVLEAENTQIEEIKDINSIEIAKDFIGTWEDNRCSLTVEDLGDGNVSVDIIWANGASEDSEWMMTGVPDADTGTMRYANGICKNVEYLDNGTVSETILYENGEGYFYIQNGYLYWVDETDHAGDDCRFERFSDSALAPVSTAETVIDPDTPYYSDEGDTMDVPHIMIENSSTEYLTDSDVYFYTPNQLRYAKNEIYARHGRRFNDSELQAWFDAQSWYSGTVASEDFQESVLSAVEKANILVIQHRLEVNSQ